MSIINVTVQIDIIIIDRKIKVEVGELKHNVKPCTIPIKLVEKPG